MMMMTTTTTTTDIVRYLPSNILDPCNCVTARQRSRYAMRILPQREPEAEIRATYNLPFLIPGPYLGNCLADTNFFGTAISDILSIDEYPLSREVKI